MLTLLKGLPLPTRRTCSDTAPLFDAAATLEASLLVMAGMVATLTVDRDRMRAAAGEGYTTATAVADALVRRGVAFRAAHHIVGALVAEAERGRVALDAAGRHHDRHGPCASDDSIALALVGDATVPRELRFAAGWRARWPAAT